VFKWENFGEIANEKEENREEKRSSCCWFVEGVKGKGRDWGFVIQRRKRPNT